MPPRLAVATADLPGGRRGRLLNLALAAMIALTLVGAAVVPGPRGVAAATGTAYTTSDLNLRIGPSLNDRILTVMPPGAEIWVNGDAQNGFYPVWYGNLGGYASADYISLGNASTPGGFPGGDKSGGGATGTATVTEDLNLRIGASTGDAVILVMPAGATLTLTGNAANGFVSVDYNGNSGWAYEAFLSTGSFAPSPEPSDGGQNNPGTTPPPGSDIAYTTTDLNLRAGAGTGFGVILVMPPGAEVTLTGVAENGFYFVYYNGQPGWASSTYLGTGGAPAPIPGDGTTTDNIVDIIYAAADRYGQPRADMLRVAQCESNLIPNAVNPAGSYGLFQFIPSTWASTPYAQYDIFDPWASANAAGWMWSVGRRNEWVCQ